MSRPLSTTFKQAMTSSATDDGAIVLLMISHDDLAETLRFTNNNEDVVSRGNTYLRFPFLFTLPDDYESRPPSARLVIDNIDRRIIEAVRSLSSPPTVTAEVVALSDLETVELGPIEFQLRDVTADALTVEGTLAFEPVLEDAWPATRMTPATTPGIFV